MSPDPHVAPEALNQEYLAAIGAVARARQEHDATCKAHGPESPQAGKSGADLQNQIALRDHIRTRYDAASRP